VATRSPVGARRRRQSALAFLAASLGSIAAEISKKEGPQLCFDRLARSLSGIAKQVKDRDSAAESELLDRMSVHSREISDALRELGSGRSRRSTNAKALANSMAQLSQAFVAVAESLHAKTSLDNPSEIRKRLDRLDPAEAREALECAAFVLHHAALRARETVGISVTRTAALFRFARYSECGCSDEVYKKNRRLQRLSQNVSKLMEPRSGARRQRAPADDGLALFEILIWDFTCAELRRSLAKLAAYLKRAADLIAKYFPKTKPLVEHPESYWEYLCETQCAKPGFVGYHIDATDSLMQGPVKFVAIFEVTWYYCCAKSCMVIYKENLIKRTFDEVNTGVVATTRAAAEANALARASSIMSGRRPATDPCK
jgi:hypothetical protein